MTSVLVDDVGMEDGAALQAAEIFGDVHAGEGVELLHHGTLGGQTVAGAQLAGQDHALQLLHEQLLQGGRHDLAEFHTITPLVRPGPYNRIAYLCGNSQWIL